MSQVALIATLVPRTLFIWLQLVNSKFCLRFPVHLESEDWYTRSDLSPSFWFADEKDICTLFRGLGSVIIEFSQRGRQEAIKWAQSGNEKVTNWRAILSYCVSPYKAGKCHVHQLLQQGRSWKQCSPHNRYRYHCLWSPNRGIDFVSARKHTTLQYGKDMLL